MPENLSRSDSDMSLGVGWVIAQSVLFVFFVIAVVSGETMADVPGLIYAQVIGLVVAGGGAVISVWSLKEHQWKVSPFPRPDDGALLVESGPYLVVRHPMYTGVLLGGIGQILLLQNWLAGPCTLVSGLLFCALRIPKEEKMLEGYFGASYRAYREDTGAILPKISNS